MCCKVSTRVIPAACAWSLLLGCTSLFFIFACPELVKTYGIAIAAYQSIVALFVIMNFGLATFMDPGFYPRAHEDETPDDDFRAPLYKAVEIQHINVRMKWCSTCQLYRPPRCSHCSVCDSCVEFLLSLTVHMWSVFALSLVYILDHRSDLQTASNIVCMCLMVIVGLLCIPVVGLTGFHIVLVARGRTTNEQVTGKVRGGTNPFTKGCFLNCSYTLCGPTWPKLTGRGQKTYYISTEAAKVSYKANDSNVRIYLEADHDVKKDGRECDRLLSGSVDDDVGVLSSNECELHPPKSDSYINLFDDGQDVPLGGSAHSLRNLLSSAAVSSCGRDSPKHLPSSVDADQRSLAPDALYSPVSHALSNNLSNLRAPAASAASGHLTGDEYQYCTQVKTCGNASVPGSCVLANDEKYPTAQAVVPAVIGLSAGSTGTRMLNHGGAGIDAVGVGPGAGTGGSLSAAVTVRTDLMPNVAASIPATTVAGAARKPLSFVKALELSEKLAAIEDNCQPLQPHQQQQQKRGSNTVDSKQTSVDGKVQQFTGHSIDQCRDHDYDNVPGEGNIDRQSQQEHDNIHQVHSPLEKRQQLGSSYEIAV